MRIACTTLGCRVNQYDTEAMRTALERAGHTLVPFEEAADVYIVNTCTVTGTGDKKSRQLISRAHGRSPQAKIVVAGCYAQRAPEELLAMPGVALVLGTKERGRIAELVEGLFAPEAAPKRSAVGSLAAERSFEEMDALWSAGEGEGRTRAYLKIQEGCDRFCSYCIIPYTRGPLRSRPLADIRRQMELLDGARFCEVVLTGIHLMSYGRDMGAGAPTLLDAIAQAEGLVNLARVRLGSLEPQMISEAFARALAESGGGKLCRQFHLSLQSGSETVLRRMKRRYGPDGYRAAAEALRKAMPGCALTTDIIVGFPGETEAEFLESLAFAREMCFARIHVFPYSRREGTPAAAMPGQLPRRVKNERAARMLELAAELEADYLQSQMGEILPVLFEEPSEEGFWQGYTDTYVRVCVKSEAALRNRLLPVRVERVGEGCVYGSVEA